MHECRSSSLFLLPSEPSEDVYFEGDISLLGLTLAPASSLSESSSLIILSHYAASGSESSTKLLDNISSNSDDSTDKSHTPSWLHKSPGN